MPVVMTVVGARPQFVKLAPFCHRLAGMTAAPFDHVIVDSGQHYDDALAGAFFRELRIPPPDLSLGVGSGSHGEQTGRVMAALEPAVAQSAPDIMVVYGDTNTTLAAALVAAKAAIPLAHVEAGLRSFRPGMPEEVNRVVADRLSALLFCPTVAAAEQLEREGRREGVHVVGDIMLDVYRATPAEADLASLLEHLPPGDGRFALATVHRAENTDDRLRLALLLEGLSIIAQDLPILLPLHPRTRAALDREGLALPAGVAAVPPVGLGAVKALLERATLVLTDSGGLQKEAYFAGTPCVTLRDETEWTETLAGGWNRLMGPDSNTLVAAASAAASHSRQTPREPVFGNGDAAGAIIDRLSDHLAHA